MRYLLLGNGFDIHHKLPTKYRDVIRVLDFWMNTNKKYIYLSDLLIDYIGMFPADNSLKEYYNTYEKAIQSLTIDHKNALDVLDPLKNNIWLKYVLKSMKESGDEWVDFEHIIGEVLTMLQTIYNQNHELDPYVHSASAPIKTGNYDQQNILSVFDEMFTLNEEGSVGCRFDYLKKNFINDFWLMDFEKILNLLYEHLQDLKKAFCFYFDIVVNSVVSSLHKSIAIVDLPPIDVVISLNYTETYEKIYEPNKNQTAVVYYHGSASKGNIVLGINSDNDDEYSEATKIPNITCLSFKKYYQRIFNKCDIDYLTIVRNLLLHPQKETFEPKGDELIIIGHSLDMTDADVLLELFDACKRIYIYYHNVKAFSDYIKKLIILLGKNKFEKMRKDGKIHFYELYNYGLDPRNLKYLNRIKKATSNLKTVYKSVDKMNEQL